MTFIVKNKLVFYILQLTWGGLMTFIGLIVSAVMLSTGHKPHSFGNEWYFIVRGNYGVSFGPCFLCGDQCNNFHIKSHESGHGIQNMVMGPLFPFLVAIPSFIRYWYRELKYNRKGLVPKTKYNDIWFEGQATSLGKKYYKEFDN